MNKKLAIKRLKAMIITKVVALALAALLANICYFHAGTTTRDLSPPMQPSYVPRPKLDYLRYEALSGNAMVLKIFFPHIKLAL